MKKPVKIGLAVVGGIIVIAAIASASGGGNNAANTSDSNANTGQTQEAKPEETSAKWDYEVAYSKIQNGMTKAQVEEATGKKSENCTESDLGELGKSELCTYGNAFTDKAAITVTYDNDGKVSTKTKSTY